MQLPRHHARAVSCDDVAQFRDRHLGAVFGDQVGVEAAATIAPVARHLEHREAGGNLAEVTNPAEFKISVRGTQILPGQGTRWAWHRSTVRNPLRREVGTVA